MPLSPETAARWKRAAKEAAIGGMITGIVVFLYRVFFNPFNP